LSSRPSRQPKKGRKPVIPLPNSGRGLSPNDAPAAPEIQALIDLAKRNQLAELEVEQAGIRIRIRREGGAAAVPAVVREVPTVVVEQREETPAPVAHGDAAVHFTVTSPIVGTFYRSPSPDADAYVEEGDIVRKGQVLCIVEAMKLMNEIESEVDGRILKILVESTKPVEYGQPLFLIDPKATL